MPAFFDLYSEGQDNVARQIYDFWLQRAKDSKASNPYAIAIGMVAMADGESSFDPNARGDRKPAIIGEPKAIGLFQQHWNPRGQEILNKTGLDIRKPDVHDQMMAGWYELTAGWYKNVWPVLMLVPDVNSAVVVLVQQYEQSANQPSDITRRTAMAKYWMTQFPQEAPNASTVVS